MTLKEQIEAVAKDIAELGKEIEELQAARNKQNQSVTDLRNSISDIETELQKEQAAYQKARGEVQQTAHTHEQKKALLQGKTNQKKEMERELSIQDLVSKQQEFWDALEARIVAKGDDINSGLHGLGETKDPATAIETLKNIVDTPLSFNEIAVKIRTTIGEYNKAITELCAYAVDGRLITPDHKSHRLFVLDRFLQDKAIQPYWS